MAKTSATSPSAQYQVNSSVDAQTRAYAPIFFTLSFYFSCGSISSVALDANSTVWIFRDWGCPIRLVSPSLDCSSPETTPIQAESGFSFCAVLMGSGDVYVWWTDSNFDERLGSEDFITGVHPIETVIPCRTRKVKMDPIKLPALPDLPDLPDTGLSGEELRKETRLIKIAAGSHYLIGLTNKGHVLVLGGLYSEDYTRDVWYYVSKSVCVLVPLLKLCRAVAALIRDRQDQGDANLPSNHG